MSIHKNKGSRQLLDNDSGIFIQPVVYAVINSIKRGREVCIDVQIYDIQKAFDSLWLDDCFIDLFYSLPHQNRNNKISLLYETKVQNLVAINTPQGWRKGEYAQNYSARENLIKLDVSAIWAAIF